MKDIIYDNLNWNTEELFKKIPNIYQIKDVNAGENIQAIKFSSIGFEPKGLKETKVFALIGTPNTPMPKGGFPAVLLCHGGAGRAFQEWVKYWNKKGYVAIAIDLYSNQLDSKLLKVINPEGGPDESATGSKDDSVHDTKNSWIYHSVTNVILAHNILRKREDVNSDKICITGISWGGYLINVVSGVDKRFAAFAPVYGSGFIYKDNYFNAEYGKEERERWIKLYDPSSYLPYSVKPMLFSAGINDKCFSARIRQESADLVKSQVFYAQHPELEHGYFWNLTYEIYVFFEYIINNKNNLILFDKVGVDEEYAFCNISNYEICDSVSFTYTTDDSDDVHSWTWNTVVISSKPTKSRIEYKLPASTNAFTFSAKNIKDEEFQEMSTKIVFIKGK